MKTLIVYYSRTGITKKAAEGLAGQLAADVEEIVDLKDRSGALGYLAGGKDATLKKLTEIGPGNAQVEQYDLVVVGTPVWAFTMAPAVRTWLTQNAKAIKQVAMFCTMGGSGAERTFRDMEGVCGKEPVVSLSLVDKDIKADLHGPAMEQFAKKIMEAVK
jgi:flavodoxin